MQGLEISKAYYQEFGAPVLEEQFSELLPFLAIGLVGEGSECLGFDDKVSQDHDFEPGFCIFLPEEDVVSRQQEFALERAYDALPQEFQGFTRCDLNPVGGKRHGVLRISHFFEDHIGSPWGIEETMQWFAIPSHALRVATGGEIWRDDYGLMTNIRTQLTHMPQDVRLKKMAGHALLAGQAGQYNYQRCIEHGEMGAAQLALYEFVRHSMALMFLLDEQYQPFYKWAFRALSQLPTFGTCAQTLEDLISTGNNTPSEVLGKVSIVESLCNALVLVCQQLGLCQSSGIGQRAASLEELAYQLNEGIQDGEIRNLHILFAVD